MSVNQQVRWQVLRKKLRHDIPLKHEHDWLPVDERAAGLVPKRLLANPDGSLKANIVDGGLPDPSDILARMDR